MKLKILGSGTIVSDEQIRNCSGYLLDDKLLFDCGPGVWRALNKNSILTTQINHILLSHFHVDHVSDLLPILLSRWMFKNERQNPVYLVGPQGIKEWFGKVIKTTTDWINDLAIRVIENAGDDLQLLSYKISCLPTAHTDHSICYRVMDHQNTLFFYSGDSDFNHNLITLAQNCNLALLESSYPQENKIGGHLTPQLAGRIARMAEVKCLVLVHLYPECRVQDVISFTQQEYKGKIILAEDDMELIF
jgi:ribonuclease BN (tRNA processing enzyme)